MSLKILDTTLRDGSNAINYDFDADLTKELLVSLEESGIRLIEMGHGMGLGAHENSGKPAALSDKMYMDIAADTLKNAKFGFLITSKYGSTEDIQLAAEKGAGFIRIGANITEVNGIEEMIKFSVEQDLYVMIALMKAYALSPEEEYLTILKKLEKWGADLVTLMDSAGHMIPKDVEQYIVKGKVHTDLELGFHAHNNLQLAIANTITAIKSGADSVDVSLGGLGRSSGNAPSEIIAVLAKRYGWDVSLDEKKMLKDREEYIYPLIKDINRFSSDAITFGRAGFHSSYSGLIKEVSEKYPELDYKDVIIKVSEHEKVNLTKELIEKIIKKELLN